MSSYLQITDRSFRYASPCLSAANFVLHCINLIPPLTLLFLFLLLSFPLLLFYLLFRHPQLPLSFTPGLKPIFFLKLFPPYSFLFT